MINAKLLQMPTSQPAMLSLYAESDYHWLVEVLDALIEFICRDENHSVPELTENDYDWAHVLLVELVGCPHIYTSEKVLSMNKK